MNLGELIRNYRNANGLTMQDFAARSGLSKGYISMLEKGKHPQNDKPIVPSIDTFSKVAKAMHTNLNELLVMVDGDQLIDLSGRNQPVHNQCDIEKINVGKRIKDRRKELGMTAEDLAASIKVSPATVYRYESNFISNMGIDKISPIARALKVSEAYLMGRTDRKNAAIYERDTDDALLFIKCTSKEEYDRLNEFVTYFRGVSEKAQAQIVERARALYEFENEENIDIDVPEEYSGPDAELVKKIRDDDVESTVNDLINKGNAELLKRDALDVKDKAE